MSKIGIRQATLEDIDDILIVEEEAWTEHLRASKEQFVSRIEIFPEGTLVALADDGVIIGVVSTEIINYEDLNKSATDLTWNKITDNGFIEKTHNPNGDTLYGIDLSISQFSLKASVLLMQSIGRMTIQHGLKQGMLGGRIPRYHKYADKISAEEYIKLTKGNGYSIKPDPEISFYRRCGVYPVRVLPNYIEDPDSCDYGVLLLWPNPFYRWPFSQKLGKLFKIK